jgi:outer membrane protein TolC
MRIAKITALRLASVLSSLCWLSACTSFSSRVPKAQASIVQRQIADQQSTSPSKLAPIVFSPEVQAWIDSAIASSASVAIAQARLDEANAQGRGSFGALFPELSANLGASDARQRSSAVAPAREDDLPVRNERQQGSLEFRWELDLFGANRARHRAAENLSQAAQGDLDAARQSLAAELQLTLVRRVAAALRVDQSQQLLTLLGKIDALEKALADSGIRSRSDWLRVRADLQTRQSEVERDQLELEAQTLRLRSLSDTTRETIVSMLTTQTLPACSTDAHFSLPLQALADRPDVAAARWRLQAALNDADAAQLDRLPSLTLTGSTGTNRQENSDLFSAITHSFEHSFGLSLVQKLFSGGRIQANADAAHARTAVQAAQYRQSLLLAAEEVDLAIATAKQSGGSARRLDAALRDSLELQKLANARQQAGIDSELDRAVVERDYLERALAANDGHREQCLAAISVRRALAQVWPVPQARNFRTNRAHPVFPAKVEP